MPDFTSGQRTNTVAGPGYTAAVVAAITADSGSRDQLLHTDRTIKYGCPKCEAVPNERCAAVRYASGRVRVFARDFHPERVDAAAAGEIALAAADAEITARHEAQLSQPS